MAAEGRAANAVRIQAVTMASASLPVHRVAQEKNVGATAVVAHRARSGGLPSRCSGGHGPDGATRSVADHVGSPADHAVAEGGVRDPETRLSPASW